MGKLDLNQITLFCFESREPILAEWAIQKCLAKANFKQVILVTDLALVSNQITGINYIQAPYISSVQNYSLWMMTQMHKFIHGTHVLVIQWDSFITNNDFWDKEFLKYDYIGAVWPHFPKTPVGNGGFSLRSKKLLKALTNSDVEIGHPEDYYTCVRNKKLLENNYDINFAPEVIAERFAVERTKWHPTFGFHGFFNFGNILNEKELIEIISKIPSEMIGGIDTYDLIDLLEKKKLNQVIKLIRTKLTFKWKYRYFYIINKIKLIMFNYV